MIYLRVLGFFPECIHHNSIKNRLENWLCTLYFPSFVIERKKRERLYFLTIQIFVSLIMSVASALSNEKVTNVTFLVFSDIYDINERNGRGGYARIAGVIQEERNKRKNIIVAHAGDTISPSLISGFDKGKHIIEILNMIKPDVFVPGNHEFDFGEDVFKKRMNEATFVRLAANLRDAKSQVLDGFVDNKMFFVDNLKIGVFGLTDGESAKISNPETLQIRPIVITATEQAKLLKDAGADLIVAVTHSDIKDDYRLLMSGHVDVILSGHDHNLNIFYNGESVIAETQSDGANVVAVDISVKYRDGSKQIVWEPQFRVIDTALVVPNPTVLRKVSDVNTRYDKEMDNEIGRTDVELDSRNASVRSKETAIGNYIADVMRSATKADVALINGGALRGNRVYPAGSIITTKSVLRELPLNNKLITLEISGEDLRLALENAVWMVGKDDGRFGQISGVRMVVRLDSVPGSRLEMVEIGGEKLDPKKTYKLATTDFLYQGKDGYDSIKRSKLAVGSLEAPLLWTVVLDSILAAGHIRPAIDGRILFK